MKIIISPSKTMQFSDCITSNTFPDDSFKRIYNKLKRLSMAKLGTSFNVKGQILDQLYYDLRHFEELKENIALKAYTGLVFKGLDVENYSEKDWEFAEENIMILSAFYGAITPKTMIKPYRLDFKTKIELDLYKYRTYSFDETVLNLASKEFSRAVKTPTIDVEFRELVEGRLINKATYAKQARGVMLNYLIKNQIKNIEGVKQFSLMGYKFDSNRSDDKSLIFVRGE